MTYVSVESFEELSLNDLVGEGSEEPLELLLSGEVLWTTANSSPFFRMTDVEEPVLDDSLLSRLYLFIPGTKFGNVLCERKNRDFGAVVELDVG